MNAIREELLQEIWKSQDEAYDLMTKYDELPHYYGETILYQAEGEILSLIGCNSNDVTITDLVNLLNKSASACSQIIRKLEKKGLVKQTKSPMNRRYHNLSLTDAGMTVYRDRIQLNREYQMATFRLLDEFTDEELRVYLKIQRKLNVAYENDIRHSREKFFDE